MHGRKYSQTYDKRVTEAQNRCRKRASKRATTAYSGTPYTAAAAATVQHVPRLPSGNRLNRTQMEESLKSTRSTRKLRENTQAILTAQNTVITQHTYTKKKQLHGMPATSLTPSQRHTRHRCAAAAERLYELYEAYPPPTGTKRSNSSGPSHQERSSYEYIQNNFCSSVHSQHLFRGRRYRSTPPPPPRRWPEPPHRTISGGDDSIHACGGLAFTHGAPFFFLRRRRRRRRN